jgi:phage baseplate assembly protein W
MISGARKVYDFKSVGLSAETLQQDKPKFTSPKPIGIKTPLQFGDETSGLFSMNFNLLNQIKDNLKVLLRTNHGERIPFYDFGANLLPIAFNISTDEGDTEAMRRIMMAINKYMPTITPTSFEPIVIREDNQEMAKVSFKMYYDIVALGVKNQQVEITLFAAG